MRIFTFIVTIILLFMGISFAILNDNMVSMHYYVGVARLPLSLLLTLAFIVGVCVGLLVSIGLFFKAKASQRHLRKQLTMAQKEIAHLHHRH